MVKEKEDVTRRCTQVQCSFYTQGGCKNCDECKSEPYTIKRDCQRCLACEGVPNSIRWGDAHKRAEMMMKHKSEEQRALMEAIQTVAEGNEPRGKTREIILLAPGER